MMCGCSVGMKGKPLMIKKASVVSGDAVGVRWSSIRPLGALHLLLVLF